MSILLGIVILLSRLLCSHCDTFSRNSYILNIHGEAQSGYHITVGVGMPPQPIHLLIDTGSSNMAILVSSIQNHSFYNYKLSNTFQALDQTLTIRYTEGSWSGFLALDRMSLGSIPICIAQAQFSCITSSENIFEEPSIWEGILGLAYASIAKPINIVEPFFDTLIKSCNVSDIFSVALCGPFLLDSDQITQDGKLILGNIFDEFYSGSILYTPILKEWYYEVMITGLKVGDTELDVPCTEFNDDKSIIDTGTTFLAFPPKIYEWIVTQMKSHTKFISQHFPADFWTNQTIACAKSRADITAFPTIEIAFSHSENSTFSLNITPDMYLLRYYPKYIFDELCFKLTVGPSDKGTIIGATVLKGFYVIFDRKNKRIGFANSTCVGTSDPASIVTYPKYTDKSLDCKYQENTHFTLQVVMYVLVSLMLVCIIPFLFTFVPCFKRIVPCRRKSTDESNLVKVIYEPS